MDWRNLRGKGFAMLRNLIGVAVAAACLSGLAAMAQVVLPAPERGAPNGPGYSGYGNPPGGPPPLVRYPGVMPFPYGGAPVHSPNGASKPIPNGRPTSDMPPLPKPSDLPSDPLGKKPALPDGPPDRFAPPKPKEFTPEPPLVKTPPVPSEPYSVYEGIATAAPLLTEPTALHMGQHYQAATKVDHTCCWVQANHLHMFIRRDTVPPLVTTGAPGTQVLLGGPIGAREFAGVSGTLGFWIDSDRSCSLELSGFFLARHGESYRIDSANVAGNSLSIPILVGGAESVAVSAAPGIASGTVDINDAFTMHGAEVNVAANWVRYHGLTVDGLLGFRYLYLNDNLTISQNLTSQGGLTFNGAAVPAGTAVSIFDSFDTRNYFYGGQIGTRVAWTHCPFEVGLIAKIAMGSTVSVATIEGNSSAPALGLNAPGGVLAQSSNSGRHSSCDFSVVPEIATYVSWQVTPHLRAIAGYQYLYWSRVERAGEQIDRNLNPALPPTSGGLVPGAVGGPPVFPDSRTYFWAHGFTVGLELKY